MTKNMLIFGLGYTASFLRTALIEGGWQVTATQRGAGAYSMAFEDEDAVLAAIKNASFILSSVPPKNGTDPVLEKYGAAILDAAPQWSGYLSSTGVYGDVKGAWVDEHSPIGTGRRTDRAKADMAWQNYGAHIFRLPGIYGPGRNMLDRIIEGRAKKIDMPNQIFSRIHVQDIVAAIIKSFNRPNGVYNIGDNYPCSQNELVDYACQLLGKPPPALLSLQQADLSPMAMGFYAENRRVSNMKAKRILAWTPQFGDYRAGLLNCYQQDGY
ncbi:NAD(P)-dependent oxidoreductase [Sphingorhabdus lutea]|uniref:NAD(P)-dependent oxidoreductase n=2 Tax=Sphingorhabdus lutea TaxID=1913578 RepID=A0A1L3JEQ4_9SPHN|nr:NAD(P)-dependent oxidoreductase [Sphingorhabdus lutea]